MAGTTNPSNWIEPLPSSWQDFPASTATAEGIATIAAEPGGLSSKLHISVPYATKSGQLLHLNIIEPRPSEGEARRRFPLVVYVQGSAWFKQDLGSEIPQLSKFAAKGYVVAVVEYRPSTVAPFPAQVLDTKTAIRFLATHADDYAIDPDRIVLWGDSSGGHTVVMTGVTLDDPALSDEPAAEQPIRIRAITDYYGPVDISRMNLEPSTQNHRDARSPEGMLIGGFDVLAHPDKAEPTVPLNHLVGAREVPPLLIVHGTKDRLVPFGQSVLLYNALRQRGQTVAMVRLDGADHGGAAFWTEQVLQIVDGFFRRHL